MWNQRQLGSANFAPRTGVAVPEFDEINRAIEFGPPFRCLLPSRMAIDLNERPGTQQWIHCEIVEADISVLTMADIQLLNQRNGNFSPDFDHSRNQAGCLEAEALVKAHWKGNRFCGVRSFKGSKMSILQGQSQLITGGGAQIYAEYRKQIVEFRTIDDAETVELVNAGY